MSLHGQMYGLQPEKFGKTLVWVMKQKKNLSKTDNVVQTRFFEDRTFDKETNTLSAFVYNLFGILTDVIDNFCPFV